MSDSDDAKSNTPNRQREVTDVELDLIRQSLRGLLFGSVSIVIQDGVIVQIDRTEKRRLRGNDAGNSFPSRR
ncbi:MAG: YezD family protein [Pirellulaceae bacterium]|nr:YezD family protein [Pirellulaceae bacterium]